MSRWNHLLCSICWEDLNPERAAVRVVNTQLGECCRCGQGTQSGIFVRADARTFPCASEKGIHHGVRA